MKSQLLRSICLTGLIAAVCLSSAAAENAAQTASSLFQQGVTAYETGDYSGALKLFRKMQEDFPRSQRAVRGWEYIALCENKLGDPYAAFEAYQQIWDNHKEFSKMQVITRNQMRIGNHYMEYKRYSVAEKIFSKILENAPYSEAAPAAQYSLGMAQYNLKKYGPARESFENVCQNFPTSQLVDDSAFMLGIVDSAAAVAADYDQTSTDRAIASFRNYIREFPTAEHVGDAQQHIRALRDRKAQSLYDQAYYYDYSGHAKSAIMHYELLVSEYPDTDCADKAKMRLAALKGEPVQGMPKDKVTYVDQTPDAGAVSSQKEQDEAVRSFKSNDSDAFGTPKAGSAPFDETRPVTTSSTTPEITNNGSAFDTVDNSNYPLKKDPAKTEDQRVERTAALSGSSSTMAATGDDWRQNQSRQVMNEYLQDPNKKQELTSFMKNEYEKEAEAQQASDALLKLYQQSNPDAVPPPVSKVSAASYVKEQVKREEKPLSETVVTEIRQEEFETKPVQKIENVWAPVPGTEVKTQPQTVEVKTVAVVEQPKTQEPTFTAPAPEAPKPSMTQPTSRIQSSNWQTLSKAENFDEVVTSDPPKYSTVSSSELAGYNASSSVVVSEPPKANYSTNGSAPVFKDVSGNVSGTTTVIETKPVVSTPAPTQPSFSAPTTASAPSFKVETSAPVSEPTVKVTASVSKPSFEVVTPEQTAPKLSTAEVTAEVKDNPADELVNSIIPQSTEPKEQPLTINVTTNSGLRVTREVTKPAFDEEKPVAEEKPVKETTGVTITDEELVSVLPKGLTEDKDPNKDAIVKAPEGTVIRTMPEAGRVSTAISQEQYQRVVEDKNVKDYSSETTLINSYKKAYTLVQKAEAYQNQNDTVNARFYYGQALDAFTALKAQAPANWRHMDVLDTRIQKCREELHRID
ncbi:outer membrane protein assembly factor BamD [bacterium]|nr:outer membrane protein assembly factor BamD [bacterium]